MKRPSPFYGIPFPEVKWSAEDRPILIIDGLKFPQLSIPGEIRGDFAYGVGLKDRDIEKIGEYVKVTALSLYDVKATSLAPLERIKTLTKLSIVWSRKLQDLSFLSKLTKIETLILSDLGKISSIDAISNLNFLSSLEISGGVDSVAKYETLKPISYCRNISHLSLSNIRVADDDLQFICDLPKLMELDVSNQWPTEQYALLSKRLKGVACTHLSPWIKLENPIGTKDVMVIGRGKPFLNSTTDISQIRRYEEQFFRLANV